MSNQLTNFSIGENKSQQIMRGFTSGDVIEKGKINTSHLVLKEVTVGGKTAHRWVDPNKGNKEHAQHGSKIDFEHKGEKKKGTVGSVMKTGEYHIKGEDGKSYAKHPHQFDSPHKDEKDEKVVKKDDEGVNENDAIDGSGDDVMDPMKYAKKRTSNELFGYINRKDADPKVVEAAKKVLKDRGATLPPDYSGTDKKDPKSTAKTAKEVEALDEEGDEAEDINEKFKTYEKIVGMVAKGTVKSGIAYGSGGVGKTHTAIEKLKSMKNPKTGKPYKEYDPQSMEKGTEDYDYVKITGKATPAAVYREMYEHNGKILIFDDCDSVLKDENSINMFKGALDSTGDGSVSNLSNASIKDSTGTAIPQRFKFKGRALFISNLSSKDMPQPLKSRSLRIDLSMDSSQTIDRIKHIAKGKDGKLTNIKLTDTEGNPISYDHEDMDAAIKFLDKNKNKTSDLNVRTLGNIVRVIHDSKEEGEDADDWQTTAKHFLLSKGEGVVEEVDEIEQAFDNVIEKGGAGSGRKAGSKNSYIAFKGDNANIKHIIHDHLKSGKTDKWIVDEHGGDDEELRGHVQSHIDSVKKHMAKKSMEEEKGNETIEKAFDNIMTIPAHAAVEKAFDNVLC